MRDLTPRVERPSTVIGLVSLLLGTLVLAGTVAAIQVFVYGLENWPGLATVVGYGLVQFVILFAVGDVLAGRRVGRGVVVGLVGLIVSLSLAAIHGRDLKAIWDGIMANRLLEAHQGRPIGEVLSLAPDNIRLRMMADGAAARDAAQQDMTKVIASLAPASIKNFSVVQHSDLQSLTAYRAGTAQAARNCQAALGSYATLAGTQVQRLQDHMATYAPTSAMGPFLQAFATRQLALAKLYDQLLNAAGLYFEAMGATATTLIEAQGEYQRGENGQLVFRDPATQQRVEAAVAAEQQRLQTFDRLFKELRRTAAQA